MLAHGKTSNDGLVELDILLQDEKTGGSVRLTEGDVLNLTCVVSDGGGGGDHGLELRFVAANEAASRQGRLSKGRQKEGSFRNIVIAPVQKVRGRASFLGLKGSCTLFGTLAKNNYLNMFTNFYLLSSYPPILLID